MTLSEESIRGSRMSIKIDAEVEAYQKGLAEQKAAVNALTLAMQSASTNLSRLGGMSTGLAGLNVQALSQAMAESVEETKARKLQEEMELREGLDYVKRSLGYQGEVQ